MLQLGWSRLLTKKGGEAVQPVKDTPVTRLSKIFSKTSFVESPADAHANNPTLDHESLISKVIPPDIDESANQEAPSYPFPAWLDHADIYNTEIARARLAEVGESSNSYSSGYASGTTSQSAPPTCNGERILDFCRSGSELTTCPRTLNYPNVPTSSLICNTSPTRVAPGLRRTHSCFSRGWLTARHRKQPWPRISGILKSRCDSSVPQSQDTNSCPAAVFNPADRSTFCRRFSLPPVGEVCHTSDDSPSPPASKIFTKFSLSPIHTDEPSISDSLMDSSFRPRPKKQRTRSPSPVSPQHGDFQDCPITNAQDSTLPLDEQSSDGIGFLPPKAPEDERPKPPFEIFRHHSTPMLPPRSTLCLNRPTVPSPTSASTQLEADKKPVLLRGASASGSAVGERLARSATSWDSLNLESKRPRALPVIDRTASGLHCVSVDTVAKLISKNSEKRTVRYVIVDCRFPYEYEGGHIKGAVNIFNHCDLVQEIFDRVPAQCPPGTSGPPRLLGEGLARRLAVPQKEPLSAPCEVVSDEDTDDEPIDDQSTCESSDLDLAAGSPKCGEESSSDFSASLSDDALGCKSEPDSSPSSGENNSSSTSSSNEVAFAVIFHCEFSSQRAPDLAAFLRSIDRISNYHRYPFLYFPEIYIMKGGYSAFYRKYASLCCPRNYVKMFHREYRPHLRLYKRLTKRVGSACLACIRPQHKLVGSLDLATADPMSSFVQSSQPSYIRRLRSMGPLLMGRSQSTLLDSFIRPAEGNSIGMDTEEVDNKENRLFQPPNDGYCGDQSVFTESIQVNHNRLPNTMDVEPPLDSPRGQFSSHSDLSSEDKISHDDSPLSLAEAVVRVGQRVIAATLSDADPSIGLAKVMDRLGCRIPDASGSQAPIAGSAKPSLKRASTVLGMCNAKISEDVPRRIPLRNIANTSFGCSFSDAVCNQTTPALARKRAVTLDYSPFTIAMHRKIPVEPAGNTPIISTQSPKSVFVRTPFSHVGNRN
ncbi:unnamed protein product [Calicophoron daubneyi]|uniref:protein-tyrosine-phosphatase n=1 Tax=Calicophoron daubneyi TaxID=300641 RepID=A0AAV2TE73_CALDB